MLYTTLGMIGVLVGMCGLTCRRSKRFRRMARTLGWHYDAKLPQIVTEDTRALAQFFNHGNLRFSNVLTIPATGAFVRVSDTSCTQFCPPANRPTSVPCTVITVELMGGRLPTLQIMPNPAAAEGYSLIAEPDYVLPASLAQVLRQHPNFYLELTPQALIYHEYRRLKISEIQPLRVRILQWVQLLVQHPQPPAKKPLAQGLTEAELQANVLLNLQANSRAQGRSVGRYVYGIILLGLLGGLMAGTWYVLHFWVQR